MDPEYKQLPVHVTKQTTRTVDAEQPPNNRLKPRHNGANEQLGNHGNSSRTSINGRRDDENDGNDPKTELGVSHNFSAAGAPNLWWKCVSDVI
jgi:hypothetical protein